MSDFTTEHPNDYMWIARKDSSSGYIISARGSAIACSSPLIIMSKVTQGIKNNDSTAFLKDGNAKMFIEAVCISYLRRLQRNESDESKKSSLAYRIRQIIQAGFLKDTIGIGNEDGGKETIDKLLKIDLFEKVVEHALKESFRFSGHEGVKIIASRIEKIEKNLRSTSTEEDTFLSCVSRSATALDKVPTQKDVYELWHDDRLRHSRETFNGIRDRLGFAWLPPAKRGEQAHS